MFACGAGMTPGRGAEAGPSGRVLELNFDGDAGFRQKADQSVDAEHLELAPHQIGDAWLRHAQLRGRFLLRPSHLEDVQFQLDRHIGEDAQPGRFGRIVEQRSEDIGDGLANDEVSRGIAL